jgi:glycosyl hydrolase family 57
MRNPMCRTLVWLSAVLQITSLLASANTSVHTSWLWHLHQPVYWPDRAPTNHVADHYQNAWDTLQLDEAGFGHPSDTSLESVFSDADRLSAYQGEPNTVLQDLSSYANSGAQVNYSGALMENVQSLAVGDPSMGYSTSWNSGNQQARLWTTTNGKPRLDLTNFTYHHCIAAFVSDETLEMDILIHQRQEEIFWNSSSQVSRGYFPAETCFSERIIPTLQNLGIAWVVVGNNHLTRSCADFPQAMVLGSGGENCDIPNKADQINPAQGSGSYITRSISVGCSPTATAPFAYQMHYARYVDPTTGAASTIIVVPADQALGWDDSYSTWDLGLISPIAAANNPSKPSFLLLAHDGDNAWGGGYSYYNQWVPQFAQTAVSDGYEPTTVEEFLSEFPPSTNDVVHVEDGGWVNAAGDFGSPIYVNWHWPPSIPNSSPNVVDPSAGVSSKADVWRVIIATENRVKTAQQIENTLTGYTNRIDQIRDPGSYGGTPAAVELGWHYYLASLDSGFVYYGCTADECWRPVIAQSNAVRNVDSILTANPSLDTTPPTVFIPQRYPYNPGTTNFGVEYSYQPYIPTNTDFWVWTYAYDVSGITNVTLLYRSNGTGNPPTQDEFKTYAGGTNTGPWVGLFMTDRSVAPQNTLLPPQYIADYYYTKVTGLTNTYVDYYVSATDSYGNTYNSPIQHVYVAPAPTGSSGGGSGGGSTTGCVGRFCVSPTTPVAGNPVTITYSPAGGPIASASQFCIHLGWNNWATVVSPDGSMTYNSASNDWVYTTTVSSTATQLDCDANNCDGAWDNNSGADYKFAVTSGPPPTSPDTPTNVVATAASSTQIDVSWSPSSNATSYIVFRGGTQLTTTSATSYDDLSVLPNTQYCYAIEGVNSGGTSTQSVQVCATTPSAPPPSVPTNVTATAVATNEINVTWSAVTGATSYILERGGNPVATVSTVSYLDSNVAANATYCYAIAASNSVGASAFSSAACAQTPAAPLPAFVLNSSVSNYPGYLLMSPGMTLYAAVRGTTLYVATWSPGTYAGSNSLNDHFIFVSTQVLSSATSAAPWAKVGTVAVPTNTVMLCGESTTSYVGWQYLTGPTVTGASNQAVKASTNAGQMQGTIDLVQQFGSMPSTLYLCAAAYATTNGGPLVAQAPLGNGSGNIVSNGFLAVPVADIVDSTGSGVLDRLNPSIGFLVQSAQSSGTGGNTITWASVPGKSYQVMYCNSLGGGWTNLPNAQISAGSGQSSLSYTDTSATNSLQRFYEIQASY